MLLILSEFNRKDSVKFTSQTSQYTWFIFGKVEGSVGEIRFSMLKVVKTPIYGFMDGWTDGELQSCPNINVLGLLIIIN